MKTKVALLVGMFVLLFSLAACFNADGVWLVKTADPNLAFEVTLPKPNLLPTVTPTAEVVEEPTAVATPVPTPDCTVKGNINAKGEKIYHLPGDPNYAKTKAEECFPDAASAEAAGYRPIKK